MYVYNISIESEVSNMHGSHAKYKNFETGNITIVPMHKGDIPKGTEDDILKKAGLK
nr:type II toxin-antitoxin system HicA family toxin [Streptococcus agalactiae]